jgi:peptide/nickel transport system substrate-binding protein
MLRTSSSGSRVARLLAGVSALALLLAACGGDSSDTGGTAQPRTEGPSGSATYALAVEVPSLNPILGSKGLAIQKSVFDWLVDIDAKGEVTPRLATSWQANADATQWTFTLRTDAKFHDLTPVTADDVISSYQAVLDTPESTIRGNLSSLDRIEKVSDSQIRFHLKFAFAAWPRQTSLLPIVPKATYNAQRFDTAPIGSGPYKVVSFSSGQPAHLTAFDEYWGPKPSFRDITVVPTPQADARLSGLQSTASGSFDLAPLTTDQVPVLRGQRNLDVLSTPSNFVAYTSFNVTQAPLSDVKLRQAIDLAIDREAITKTIYGGLAKPIGQMVAPVTFGYDASVEPTRFDPNRARQLLAESSYSGQTIPFEYPTDGELQSSNDLAQAIQGYLQAVGIRVELQGQPSATFIPSVQRRGMKGMYMFSWRPSVMDAFQVLNLSFRPSNWGYANNPQMEDLIVKSAAETDVNARKALIGQVWKLSQSNVFFAPLFNDQYHYGLRTDRVSYTPRADGLIFPHELRQK